MYLHCLIRFHATSLSFLLPVASPSQLSAASFSRCLLFCVGLCCVFLCCVVLCCVVCQLNFKSAVLITGLITVTSLCSSMFTSLYNCTLWLCTWKDSAVYSAALGHGVESQGCTYIHCTLDIVHCTGDTAHCVQCTLYRFIQWAPGIRRLTRQPICLHYTTTSLTQGYCVRRIVFSVRFTVYSVQRTAYSV